VEKSYVRREAAQVLGMLGFRMWYYFFRNRYRVIFE
jgi:hypothetical protein